jgi:hypothetical protein
MQHRRAISIGLSVLTAGAMLSAAAVPVADAATPRAAASASQTAGSLTTAVTGTVNGVDQTGTFTINRFVRSADSILAVGNLTLGGTNFGTVQLPVTVTDPPGSCQILHLDLGPLDLNLLGLQVHLNEVVLDITAQQGSGNLLGNLLCAVAHLLDNTGGNPLSGITALLNRILGALNL